MYEDETITVSTKRVNGNMGNASIERILRPFYLNKPRSAT